MPTILRCRRRDGPADLQSPFRSYCPLFGSNPGWEAKIRKRSEYAVTRPEYFRVDDGAGGFEIVQGFYRENPERSLDSNQRLADWELVLSKGTVRLPALPVSQS